MTKPIVSIVIGSDSDLPVIKEAVNLFEDLKVPHEIVILSAHRTPLQTISHAKKALGRGIKVIIAAAGGAAHLPGVIAAFFPLPVIGIPVKTATLNGIDSLYSIVQMPSGIPVATVGINASQNAALLAVEILAIADSDLKARIETFRENLKKKVRQKSTRLKKIGIVKYLRQMEVK